MQRTDQTVVVSARLAPEKVAKLDAFARARGLRRQNLVVRGINLILAELTEEDARAGRQVELPGIEEPEPSLPARVPLAPSDWF